MSVSEELYQQQILHHNREPQNCRRIENPTHMAKGINPLCGDEYTVYMIIDASGTIQDIAFEGRGCAISKASASLMTSALLGKPESAARQLFGAFHNMVVHKENVTDDSCDLGKLAVFSGVWRYPSRVKCAALCWHAMKSALDGEAAVSTEDKL
ncbi:MAG: SUF system NifU family Fe-S cluster assembly protein [Verrucomicrobia bacterium]|nr:SUF system NifU family Fe-S cluster assembly protein [Verrucomicrobiota bacterium]